MSQEVIFEDDDSSNTVGNISIVPGAPKGMLAWLVKKNVVQNAKQAEVVLLVVTIGAVLLTIVIFVFFTGQPTHSITPEEKTQLQEMLIEMHANQP